MQVLLLLAALVGGTPSHGCSGEGDDCAAVCTTNESSTQRRECSCHVQYGRCACVDEAAALGADGRCRPLAAAPVSGATGCAAGQLPARALLAVAAAPSPELSREHLACGQLSTAMAAILQVATAAALGVDAGSALLVEPRVVAQPNDSDPVDASAEVDSQLAGHGGHLLAELEFGFCAPAGTEWPGGASFERRFRRAAQGFLALEVSSMRFLALLPWTLEELEEHLGGGGQEGDAAPAGSDDGGAAAAGAGAGDEGPSHAQKVLLWVTGGAVVATAATGLALAWLARARCRARRGGSGSPSFSDFAAEASPASPPAPESRSPHGPSGGALACVARGFDASAAEGAALAAAAGVEAHECLHAAKGEIVEVFARGEGWLYGTISSSGDFGYFPEACVDWIDATLQHGDMVGPPGQPHPMAHWWGQAGSARAPPLSRMARRPSPRRLEGVLPARYTWRPGSSPGRQPSEQA